MTKKKSRLLTIATAFIVMLAVMLVAFPLMSTRTMADNTFSGGGSGTSNDPYILKTAGDFELLSTKIIQANTAFISAYYKLGGDIDLTGKSNWYPIGYDTTDPRSSNQNKNFSGTFDGAGHSIKGYTYKAVDTVVGIGIFGYCTNATIKNLVVENINVSGHQNVGGVVGKAVNTTIENCVVTGSLGGSSGNAYVGGVAGTLIDGSISNCLSAASISGNYNIAAGIAADGTGTLSNSYSYSTITGSGTTCGVSGGPSSSNCYWVTEKFSGSDSSGAQGDTLSNVIDTVNNWSGWTKGADNYINSGSDKRTHEITLPYPTSAGMPDSLKLRTNEFNFVTEVDDSGNLTREWKEYTSITSADEFQNINNALAGNYVLENDITLPASWNAIAGTSGYMFTGCFEGNGHTITIGASSSDLNSTLVPFFNNGGVIHNLKAAGSVEVSTYFGSIVSYNGIGGYVINCSSTADITSTGSGNVGGIVAANYGTVYGCQFSGSTSGSGSYYGGIAAQNYGKLTNSVNTADISGYATVGGIAGNNGNSSINATISNCLNAGNITATGSAAGGIAGGNYDGSTIDSCLTSGKVKCTGATSPSALGGITPINYGTITNTYMDLGQFSGEGVGESNTTAKLNDDYAQYPWNLKNKMSGWNAFNITSDKTTGKKRALTYTLPYPKGTTTATKSANMYDFNTNDGRSWKSYTSIKTEDQLKTMADDLGGCYLLEGNITLTGEWLPVGMNQSCPFTGILEGQGYTISGLNITTTDGNYQGLGLFGYAKGIIRNVNVKGTINSSKSYAGGIAGYASDAEITGCSFTGSINAFGQSGGIVGCSYGTTIAECTVNGAISGNVEVGGIVGLTDSNTSISRCSTSGSVTCADNGYTAGGIAGVGAGCTITDCFSSCTIGGKEKLGGICGNTNGTAPTIKNCIFAGVINCDNNLRGGIAGTDAGTFTNCYYNAAGCDKAISSGENENCKALSLMQIAQLTKDNLDTSVWDLGSCKLTKDNVTYNTYKMDITLPKLKIMKEAVKSSSKVYNFGLDGAEDYEEYTPITTVSEFEAMENDPAGNYVIMTDSIDASNMSELFTDENNPFTGKLAGNGCKITVKNTLIGYNSGLIMGIRANGEISANGYYLGAIVGQNNDGTIYDCSFSGSVTALGYSGGICGISYGGVIRKCWNSGTITSTNAEFAGGICGISYGGVIRKCWNSGTITSTNAEFAGGITGKLEHSKITDCFNTGRITAKNSAGGIVGDAISSEISNVLNAGVAAINSGKATWNTYCGGIMGTTRKDSSYTNCFYIAELSGANMTKIGESVSIADIESAATKLGSAWSFDPDSAFGTVGSEDDNGFKSQIVTLPSLNGVGEKQTATVYQFNFKNPEDTDNKWLYAQKVTTVEELQNICITANAALANDIKFTDSDPYLVPLNTQFERDYTAYFSGNNHTISNMKFRVDAYSNGALFSLNYGTIMDLTIDGEIETTGDVSSSKQYVAAFCSSNYGTLIRCHNAANIVGGFQTASGLVKGNNGDIINCWNTGDITAADGAAGIVWRIYDGSVKNCYNIGTISANNNSYGISSDETDSDLDINNVYYLSDKTEDPHAKNSEQFESGEVAYLLNGDQTSIVWGQKIGTDKYPVTGGLTVYKTSPCPSYTNDVANITKQHNFVNGQCTSCGEYSEPEQDADGFYLLDSKTDLMWFSDAVNSGRTNINARLTADIVVNEDVLDEDGNPINGSYDLWTPVGTSNAPYEGTFQGKGLTISGLVTGDKNISPNNAGLFGCIKNAHISDLTIADSWISGDKSGSIAASAEGSTIENCVNKSYIYGYWAGGIVWQSIVITDADGDIIIAGSVKNCVNAGTVMADSGCAGIVGESWGNLSGCANYGSVLSMNNGNDSATCSGIVLEFHKDYPLTDCMNAGIVKGKHVAPLFYSVSDNNGAIDDATILVSCVINSFYNTDLYAADTSIESEKWLEENCGKTTAELTSGDVFASWAKEPNDYENNTLYYPVPSSVKEQVDKAVLAVSYTAKITLTNTDTDHVYGNDLNFTADVGIKPQGVSEYSSAGVLCESGNFELYHGDENLANSDYAVTIDNDGVVSVTVSKDIDAGKQTFIIKGVSGLANGMEAECNVTIEKKLIAESDITVPTAKNAITYGQKLSAVTLSDTEWEWADVTTVPQVQNNGFEAVFNVTDDNNFDYTAIDGYSAAAHTITRKINVTVDIAKPTIIITLNPSTNIAGGKISVSAQVSNSSNDDLDDLPDVTFTYTIGGVDYDITNGEFTIPDDAQVGDRIIVTATTESTDNYAENTATKELTVTNCTHDDKYLTLSYDENSHWYDCSNCGAERLFEETHSGGEATCVSKAECSTCHQKYGDIDSSNHKNISTEWSSDENSHWHECSDCHTKLDKAAHTSSGTATPDKAETCTVCDYEISPATGYVAAPVISPNGGTFSSEETVTITCPTIGADIYYTTDGTEPTTASTKYTGEFTISETTVVKAIAVKPGMGDSTVVTSRFTKKSSSGGSGGGGGYRPSRPTRDNKPSINGIEKSWAEITADISKLPIGGTAVINLNGETTVPADIIRAISERKANIEFVFNSTRSWIVDGSKITTISAADFSMLTGNADRSALRGVFGDDFKINDTGVPAALKLTFRKEFAGQFANLYKVVDGKLVFQGCAKVIEDGSATVSGANEKGEYIVMVCEFSDKPGDMNNDGTMNALDAAAILRRAAGMETGTNPLMADFNGDGAVNALDASAILKWLVAV